MLLPVLLTWFENSVQTLLPSADLCCSLLSFLAPVCCSMTSLIGKIVYTFLSTGGFGDFVGLIFFFFNESPWANNETTCFSSSLSALPPKWNLLAHMCHDVLGCTAGCWSCPWLCCFYPFSVERKHISCSRHLRGTLGEQSALSTLRWFNCRGQVLYAVQMTLAWLESSPGVGEGILWVSSSQPRNGAWAWARISSVVEEPLVSLGYLVWVLGAIKISRGDFWL